MKKTLDTYFTVARHTEVAVDLPSVEKLIESFNSAPATSGIRSIFTKNRYIMNSLTGIIIVSSLTLLTYFNLPHHGPQNQSPVIIQNDTNYRYEETIAPDTIPKNPKKQDGTTSVITQSTNVPVQDIRPATSQETFPNDSGTAIRTITPAHTSDSESQQTGTVLTPKPQIAQTVSCCKPKKPKPLSNQIEEVSDFSYNGGVWAMVSLQCLYGMMNREAEIVVPVEYEKIDKKFKYNDKLWCKVIKNGLCGFIDTEGHEVVPCIYEDLTDFNFNDRQWAKGLRDGYMYFIDKEGKEVKIKTKENP